MIELWVACGAVAAPIVYYRTLGEDQTDRIMATFTAIILGPFSLVVFLVLAVAYAAIKADDIVTSWARTRRRSDILSCPDCRQGVARKKLVAHWEAQHADPETRAALGSETAKGRNR